jgi:hypothetical protein
MQSPIADFVTAYVTEGLLLVDNGTVELLASLQDGNLIVNDENLPLDQFFSFCSITQCQSHRSPHGENRQTKTSRANSIRIQNTGLSASAPRHFYPCPDRKWMSWVGIAAT